MASTPARPASDLSSVFSPDGPLARAVPDFRARPFQLEMAEAVAEGARAVPGTEVTIKRVPELVPEEVAKKSGMKLNQPAPICSVDELATYDAISFGTPTPSATCAHKCATSWTRPAAFG